MEEEIKSRMTASELVASNERYIARMARAYLVMVILKVIFIGGVFTVGFLVGRLF